MRRRSGLLLLLGTLLPLGVWFVCLSLLYGTATLAYTGPLSQSVAWYSQIVIGSIGIVVLVMLLASGSKLERRFFRTLSVGLCSLALAGTVWLLATILLLKPC